ncbi:septum site-determining protein MinC [Entomobacter blattae]|uniref:Probable septum site-determining protein MinC n=1 Tax=Entomobacter blattae TaxID=2762277 RepID=A0A7H1NUX0_9PROT|nr:septum site-determining protein MinC [Entomobacter blattae]QNT79580.1 Septum site-determining protein MinC [Entomobacter blattae]
MSDMTRTLPKIRARGRSFLALVLYPEAPLADWLHSLEQQMAHSSDFFAGKPVILNLEMIEETTENLSSLYQDVQDKGLVIISIEGGDPTWPALSEWTWPTILSGGRTTDPIELPDPQAAEKTPPPPSCLVIEEPVRSGQSITFPSGDIVIVGSVASGAEISAGGSIHIYGSLRGRAIAGMNGQSDARIFTSMLYAELLAINGFYITAEDINPEFLGKNTQTRLIGNSLTIEILKKRV